MTFAQKSKSVHQKTVSEKMKQTLASLRLEGLSLSDDDLHDLQEFEAGHITKNECLLRALKRVKSSQS